MDELIALGQLVPSPLYLEQGEVSVWAEGRLIEILEAPAWLGLIAFATGQPSSRSVRAEGPVVVRPRAPEADAIQALLSAELERVQQERLDLIRSLDDVWGPEATLVPGPYAFGPFRATVVWVESDRAHLEQVLPPGLHRVPGPARWVLVCADLTGVRSLAPGADGRRWRYQETTPLFPCLSRRGPPGLWVPELWPDALYPTLLGREIHGFPKRVARTRLTAGGIDVLADQQRIIRGRWGAPEPVELPRILRWLTRRVSVPVYVRQRLLHRRRLQSYRLDALVCVPFSFEPAEQVHQLGHVELQFAPDHPVLRGRPVAAWHLQTGFRFGRSRRVRDYTRSWGLRS